MTTAATGGAMRDFLHAVESLLNVVKLLRGMQSGFYVCITHFFAITNYKIFHNRNLLLVEISFQQSCENRTVTGFVLCHFVNGVVNGVVAQLFCALCDFEFSGAFSLFGALNSACAKKAGA